MNSSIEPNFNRARIAEIFSSVTANSLAGLEHYAWRKTSPHISLKEIWCQCKGREACWQFCNRFYARGLSHSDVRGLIKKPWPFPARAFAHLSRRRVLEGKEGARFFQRADMRAPQPDNEKTAPPLFPRRDGGSPENGALRRSPRRRRALARTRYPARRCFHRRPSSRGGGACDPEDRSRRAY